MRDKGWADWLMILVAAGVALLVGPEVRPQSTLMLGALFVCGGLIGMGLERVMRGRTVKKALKHMEGDPVAKKLYTDLMARAREDRPDE